MPEVHVALDPEPEKTGPDAVKYDVEGVVVRLTRRGSGWDYERPGLDRPVHIPGLGDQPLGFNVRIAADEAVARFALPLFVPPGDRVDLWIVWPLEIVVLAAGRQLDCLAPGRRRTLFGTVSDGRILPAATCAPLAGPAPGELAGRPFAALAVHVANRGDGPATLSRVPVLGSLLALHRSGQNFAAVGVRVELHGDGRAEATSKAGSPPTGFQLVAAAKAPPGQIANLGWLLDATRRSVEFPL